MSGQNGDAAGRQASRLLRNAAPVVFALVLGLRVYLVTSGRAGVDAGECVLGLMARQIAAGLSHPLYLWGQRFGAGAGLEAHVLGLMFAVAGTRVLAIKLLALAIWTGLALATWRAGERLLGPRAGALTLLFMAASPQAALWSLKLRGGHLTALIALMLALNTADRALRGTDAGKRAPMWAAAAGGLAMLAGWLHPIAAPAAAALLIVAGLALLFQQRFGLLAAMAVSAGAILMFALAMTPASGPGVGPAFGASAGAHSAPVQALAAVAGTYAVHLDANLLNQPGDLPALAPQLLAVLVWSALLIAALIANALDLGDDTDERLPIAVLLAMAVATPVAVMVAARARCEPRHLLALYPVGALLLARAAARTAEDLPGLSRAAVGALAVTGLLVNGAMVNETRLYNPGAPGGLDRASAAGVIELLKAHRINRVFCADAAFKWNLIFMSQEQVLARGRGQDELHPQYADEVNRAALDGEPIAVVIPNPDLGDRRALLETLQREPHSAIEWVPGDVAIVYGVPADVAFKLFPLK